MNKLEMIRNLRESTSAPLNLCKKALEDGNWDMEEAIVILQKMGELKKAAKAQRKTEAGRIHSYLHHNGKLGVLVEVNCESDFSANTTEFKEFCENVAIQIAGADPKYLNVNDIPEKQLAKQREIFIAQLPAKVNQERIEHIINGKMAKWFGEVCLIDQKSVVVDRLTVEQMRESLVQKISENVVIKRFVRWELGE